MVLRASNASREMSAAHTRAENTWTPHGVTKTLHARALLNTHTHSVIVARLAAPATFGAFSAYHRQNKCTR